MEAKIIKKSIDEINFPEPPVNNKISINFLKYIYKKRIDFHKTSHNLEIVIALKFDNKDINIAFPFYICLLIEDNLDLINFLYQWVEVINVNTFHEKYKKNKIIEIILAKIILVLINNYKKCDEYDETSIEEENKEIIKKNIHFLKDMGLDWKVNDIYEKSIDEIFIEIIISLFNKNINKYYEYMYDLLDIIDFDFQDLPEKKRQQLFNILEDENLLIDKSDFFDEKKINCYFLILKYILKKNDDISKIKIFSEAKSSLIDLMKNNLAKLQIVGLNKDFKMRYIYVLKTLLDQQYNENNLDNIFETNTNEISTQDNQQNQKEEKNIKDIIPFEKIKLEEKKYTEINNIDNERDSRKKIETLIKTKISKGQSNNTLKISEELYQTRIINPDNPNSILLVEYNETTKEIIRIIDGA